MTSLILMYVFYDKNGDIKAIMPTLNEQFANTFSVATFPLSEVEMFLSSEKNTFDYMVKHMKKLKGTGFAIIEKESAIGSKRKFTRTLDSYLTKIEDTTHNKCKLVFIHDIINKRICVELNGRFKDPYLKTYGTEEDQEIMYNFFNSAPSTVYLTEKDNPYHLLFSFSFTPEDFLTLDRLYFSYTDNFSSSSLYTKKLINGYGYKEEVL
jgi:hypothetical protein